MFVEQLNKNMKDNGSAGISAAEGAQVSFGPVANILGAG